MKKSMCHLLLLFTLAVLQQGCVIEEERVTNAEGLKPIYAELGSTPVLEESRKSENLGAIVYKAPYIFINERHKGIHIIDNSSPQTPVKIGFLRVDGCTNFTIRDDYIYAMSARDLLTIQLTNLEVLSISRIQNFVSEDDWLNQSRPEHFEGYFECVDVSKGIVVGWESAILENPDCRTF